MAVDSTGEIVALALTFLVHVGGAALLVWAMLDGSEQPGRGDWRGWWPRDDDGDPEDGGDPDTPGGDVAPLPWAGGSDFDPSSVRLREPRDPSHTPQRPRPARRPEHQPGRTPERTPS